MGDSHQGGWLSLISLPRNGGRSNHERTIFTPRRKKTSHTQRNVFMSRRHRRYDEICGCRRLQLNFFDYHVSVANSLDRAKRDTPSVRTPVRLVAYGHRLSVPVSCHFAELSVYGFNSLGWLERCSFHGPPGHCFIMVLFCILSCGTHLPYFLHDQISFALGRRIFVLQQQF